MNMPKDLPIDVSDMKDYLAWHEVNPGFDPRAYVYHVSQYDLLMCTMVMLRPTFVLHGECVFFSWKFSVDVYDAWYQRLNGDRASIERVMNHSHICSLFPCLTGHNETNIRFVAEAIRAIWEDASNRELSERRVVVALEAAGPPADWNITLYQPD
jgi:hypothetical protein